MNDENEEVKVPGIKIDNRVNWYLINHIKYSCLLIYNN